MSEIVTHAIKPRRKRKNARTKEPSAPLTKRGEETKEKIRKTTARLLEKRSYRDLRLSDIVEESGYTIGVFYYYYKDKQSVAVEVLEHAFADDRRSTELEELASASPDLFDVVYRATLEEALVYKKHPGLIRSAAQFADEEPALAEAFRRRNQDWTARIAADFSKRFAASGITAERCHALASFLNDAINNFLNEYYVMKNPAFQKAFKTPEEVSRFLATCWYRLLFLENPGGADLDGFEEFTRISKGHQAADS